jgi:hypothetical protein
MAHYAHHKFRGEDKWCIHPVGKTLCFLPREKHRDQTRPNPRKRRPYKYGYKKIPTKWIGIDGEGVGKSDHKYIFLAAATENRKQRWSVENKNGLKTTACLDFILWLPEVNTRITDFSFGYDSTKILRDVDNENLYKLFRPSIRRRRNEKRSKMGPKPIQWKHYIINWLGGKLTVSTKKTPKRHLWDVWKFFQCTFVAALKEWKVGDPAVLKHMQYMKDNRSEFDKLSFDAVKEYCFDECAYMAQLSAKLYDAHETAGLKLRNLYGAGSSGAAMLESMEIKDKITACMPEMIWAVASAYFGGRFECSVLGTITDPVYNYDISSAYPYQIYHLPCLEHAKWTLIKNRSELDKYERALVHYALPKSNTCINQGWGPFPFRDVDGSISFPTSSGGGWVWQDEYKQGEKLFSNVVFKEAWVMHKNCDCHLFKRISEYYLERLKIGKEGAGIAIKLGTNSVAGKIMQSIGNAIFNDWRWAGMITSGCRAQALEAAGLHKDMNNLFMIATDGIYTREVLPLPEPKDTGTLIRVLDRSTGKKVCKPLGGWETTTYWKGIFFARPGVYFPLDLPNAAGLNREQMEKVMEQKLKSVKGRGVGRGTILHNHERIKSAWESNRDLNEVVVLNNVSRFCGAKTSITRSGRAPNFKYTRASALPGFELPSYGQWINKKIKMGFNPMPKREGLNPDGITLKLRSLDESIESTPYDKALRKMGVKVKHVLSKEAEELIQSREELIEQPDLTMNGWDDAVLEEAV